MNGTPRVVQCSDPAKEGFRRVGTYKVSVKVKELLALRYQRKKW